jgi:Tfp pilus assembly protein PilN
MADTTDLLNQIISRLDKQGREITAIRTEQGEKQDEQGRDIKSVKQDVATLKQDVATVKDVQHLHSEKLDKLDVKIDRLEDGQNRQLTSMKILQGVIEETRVVVDKILHRPHKAD